MNLKELRIGNIIGYKPEGSDTQLRITIRNGAGLDAIIANEKADVYRGIGLTEEWVIKLGFRCINPEWKKFTYFNGIYKIQLLLTINQLSIFNINDADQHLDIPIPSFVHQLQNLVFSLTGNELIPNHSSIKYISQDLLQEILEYIVVSACRIKGEVDGESIPNIEKIRAKSPHDYSVVLYDKVNLVLSKFD